MARLSSELSRTLGRTEHASASPSGHLCPELIHLLPRIVGRMGRRPAENWPKAFPASDRRKSQWSSSRLMEGTVSCARCP